MLVPRGNIRQSRDDLLALVASSQEQIARLQEQVVLLQEQLSESEATVEELRKENAELKRAGKRQACLRGNRQAAPFSKGVRTKEPKRPGRKPGIGSFSYRRPPSPNEVTAPPVDVPACLLSRRQVTADICPGCGGSLHHERVDVAYVTDIPPCPNLW